MDPAPPRWAGNAPLRLLVGPFVAPEHCAYMKGAFADFDSVTFGSWAGADLILPPAADFRTVLDALPEGWTPDLMIWWRPEYTTIPEGLENAPFPIAMLISDWYLAWNDTLSATEWADVVVTGTRGERVLRTAGVENVVALPMLGFEPGVDGAHPRRVRDIDVLCAGNPNWSIHPEREHVVAALLDLPPTVDYLHPPYVDRIEYNRLLGRSRIVVNQTVIGEINMKCYEVPAAGACLFVERDNLDIRHTLVDGESVVLFDRDDVVEKVLHYLAHEDERAAIARAGQEAMRARTYRDSMRRIVEHLRSRGPEGLRTRKIIRRDPLEIARRRAVHTTHRLLGDRETLVRIDAATSTATPRDVAIRAAAHARARKAIERTEDEATLPALDLRRLVDEASSRAGTDPCLDLVAFFFAVEDGEEDDVRARFARIHEDLTGGAELGSLATFVLPLDFDHRAVIERAQWEALEAGNDPEPTLRTHLLDVCTVAMAQWAETRGHDDEAIALLETALDSHPEGRWARPLLAAILVRTRRTREAIEVLDAHCARHPLDEIAALNRVVALLQSGDTKRTREAATALRHQTHVFCTSQWNETLDRVDGLLAQMQPLTARRAT